MICLELYNGQILMVVIIFFRGISLQYFSDVGCSCVEVLCLQHQQSWYCTYLSGTQCDCIKNFMKQRLGL
jgi:hypothetical protein